MIDFDRIRNVLNLVNFQLTRKLLDMDKKNAVWEMRSIVITRHSTDSDYSVYEALLAGYNTRLSQDDIVKKLRNVLGSRERDSGTNHLKVRQVYTSGKSTFT